MMPIGDATIETSVSPEQVTGLRFDEYRLYLLFRDGRELSLSLALYPSLEQATPAQRERWEMIGPYEGFTWEELDLDLSIDQLICGRREGFPPPPSREMLEKLQKQLAEEENEHRH